MFGNPSGGSIICVARHSHSIVLLFRVYCNEFEQLEDLVVLVDVTMFAPFGLVLQSGDLFRFIDVLALVFRANFPEMDELETFEESLVINLEEKFPLTLYSPLDWNLREVRAVHVEHTRTSCGYVLVDERNGRKIVFSGDTRPCDLLVSQGKGWLNCGSFAVSAIAGNSLLCVKVPIF
jgi:hypothetical protein